MMRALLDEVYLRAPDFWKLPCGMLPLIVESPVEDCNIMSHVTQPQQHPQQTGHPANAVVTSPVYKTPVLR